MKLFLAMTLILSTMSAFAQNNNINKRVNADAPLQGLMKGLEKKYEVVCQKITVKSLVNDSFKAEVVCPGKIEDSMTIILRIEGSDILNYINVEKIDILTAG